MPKFGEMKPVVKFWHTLSWQANNCAWLIMPNMDHRHVEGIIAIDRDRNGIATRIETKKTIFLKE